jgi:hypothetical protein
MENVKPREQFFEPDPRCASSVVIDRNVGEIRDGTLDDHYADLGGLDLNPEVPEQVAGYINLVKTLYLYGWLYYPFFATCQCLSGMAIEMALRTRLPSRSGKRDGRTLKKLLLTANDKGLLRDDGFPSLARKRALAREVDERFEKVSGLKVVYQGTPYVEILAELVPKIRNQFAHPHANWILTPGMALDSILLAVEIANQLWP